MSITTRAKTVLSTTVASLALLTLTASPSLADTHNEIVKPTASVSSSNEGNVSQEQTSQTTPQTNQTPQQPNQTGCCCKNMMNNMQEMMHNMPGMMNNGTNPSR